MHIRSRWIAAYVVLLAAMFGSSVAVAAPKHASLVATYDRGAIHLQLTIDNGFHAQSHQPLDPYLIPLSVTMANAAGVTFDEPQYPEATVENYPPARKSQRLHRFGGNRCAGACGQWRGPAGNAQRDRSGCRFVIPIHASLRKKYRSRFR